MNKWKFTGVNKKIIFLLLFVGVLGLFTGGSVYWVLFWFVSVWILGSLLWIWFLCSYLELDVEFEEDTVVRTEQVDFNIKLFNESWLPFPCGKMFIYSGDYGSTEENIYHQNQQISLNSGSGLEIEDIHPLSGWQRTFTVKCFNCGQYVIGPVTVLLSSPLANVSIEKYFAFTKTIKVIPRLLSASGQINTDSIDPQGDNPNNLYTSMDYTEYRDVRPFIKGDPPKLIDWKLSARHNELLVRRVEHTGEARMLICLENSQYSYTSLSDRDLALEKTLALTDHLLAKGYHVGLYVLDEEKRYLAPGKGRKQLEIMRTLLAKLELPSHSTRSEQLITNLPSLMDVTILWVTPYISQYHLSAINSIAVKEKSTLFFTDPDMVDDRVANLFDSYKLIFKDRSDHQDELSQSVLIQEVTSS